MAIASSTAARMAGSVPLTVACHRNLTVASDPRWVLQHAYRVLLVNKAQDLGTTK